MTRQPHHPSSRPRALALPDPVPPVSRLHLTAAAILALALLFLLAAPASAKVAVRTIEHELPLDGATLVSFDGEVGEVTVAGTDGDRVRVEVELRCDGSGSRRCREAAERVVVKVSRKGQELALDVDRWPSMGGQLSIRAQIEIPRDRALEIDMGVGEVRVSGMSADVEIDLGVGDVRVAAAEGAVRSLNLDTGVGDARLEIAGRSVEGSGFVGRRIDWKEGRGQAHIEIDNGVGDIRVTLE